MMANRRWLPLADGLWLLALSLYVLAGVPLATFHGDEAMQIHMSRDYATAFLEGAPDQLVTSPPYPIDSDPHLRIINGSINRYTVGLSWHLAGFSPDDLPPPPGWDWGLTYSAGVETGHRPDERLLTAARLPSALFLCASIAVMFKLASLAGGRFGAYFASGVYALHPVILLNGRHAMQEGSLLCFGLLTVLVAACMSRRRADGRTLSVGWWLALALASALTLASKHSGIVFVAGAFAWLIAAEWVGRRDIVPLVLRLTGTGILAFALFVALSPALWNDPLARLGDLLRLRQELLDIQVAIDPIAPTTLSQRVVDLALSPFIAPLQHYELPSWGEDAAFLSEVGRYETSPLSGIHFGWLLGVPLTILAGIGVVACLRRRQPFHAGLLAWSLVTALSLLVNPLPWQRYTLPWIPVVVLLAGVGVEWIRQRFMRTTPGLARGSRQRREPRASPRRRLKLALASKLLSSLPASISA